MKHLYLLRHAKSSWTEPALRDHDRPLAPRGRRAAKLIASDMRREHVEPELVLCSSARRTRETLERIASAIGDGVSVQFERELYAAGSNELLERLHKVPERVTSVLLIGHNPGLQDLALALSARGPALSRVREKFPTAALATLAIPKASWAELEEGDAELVAYVVPRELG